MFNQRMLRFEPILEEWPVSVEMSLTLSDEKGAESGANVPPQTLSAGEEDGGSGRTWVHSTHVHSQHLLNLNLTEHQMNSICTTLLAWRTDLDSATPEAEGHPAPRASATPGPRAGAKGTKQASTAKHCAYRISNRCGLPLRISSTLSHAQPQAAGAGSSQYVAGSSQYVSPMDCQALCFMQDLWRKSSERGKGSGRRSSGSHQRARVLTLCVALLQDSPETTSSSPTVRPAPDVGPGSMGGSMGVQDDAQTLAPHQALASFFLPLLLDAHEAQTKVGCSFCIGQGHCAPPCPSLLFPALPCILLTSLLLPASCSQ